MRHTASSPVTSFSRSPHLAHTRGSHEAMFVIVKTQVESSIVDVIHFGGVTHHCGSIVSTTSMLRQGSIP
jgi:hypothetical protein